VKMVFSIKVLLFTPVVSYYLYSYNLYTYNFRGFIYGSAVYALLFAEISTRLKIFKSSKEIPMRENHVAMSF
jgi:hypothetical protein